MVLDLALLGAITGTLAIAIASVSMGLQVSKAWKERSKIKFQIRKATYEIPKEGFPHYLFHVVVLANNQGKRSTTIHGATLHLHVGIAWTWNNKPIRTSSDNFIQADSSRELTFTFQFPVDQFDTTEGVQSGSITLEHTHKKEELKIQWFESME